MVSAAFCWLLAAGSALLFFFACGNWSRALGLCCWLCGFGGFGSGCFFSGLVCAHVLGFACDGLRLWGAGGFGLAGSFFCELGFALSLHGCLTSLGGLGCFLTRFGALGGSFCEGGRMVVVFALWTLGSCRCLSGHRPCRPLTARLLIGFGILSGGLRCCFFFLGGSCGAFSHDAFVRRDIVKGRLAALLLFF